MSINENKADYVDNSATSSPFQIKSSIESDVLIIYAVSGNITVSTISTPHYKAYENQFIDLLYMLIGF